VSFCHFRNDRLRHAPHPKHIGVKSSLDVLNVMVNRSAWEPTSALFHPYIHMCTWHDQACIVDQDVNSPFLLNDLLYNFLNLVILRNIEGKLFYRRFIFEIPKS
jgi:hypothetical protein